MRVFDHLWQSTLVAMLVWLVTLLFREHSARVRHGLWLAASLKFLLPFSLLTALGARSFVHTVPAHEMAMLAYIRPVAMPFSAVVPVSHGLPWAGIAVALWLAGAVAIMAVWLLRGMRLNAIARAARPLEMELAAPVRVTAALLEPGLVGIWRPVILLPEGIFRQLAASEIDAILRHELCHLRRRDNLWAALHMLAEALFWFHPLVWFIGARLVEEREAACDEGVLAEGQNPREYAEAILRVCRFYLRSPLPCASGVAGADLGRRVDAIMAGRALEDMDGGRKLLLAGLLIVSLAVPFAAGGLKLAPPAGMVQRLATALLPPAPPQPSVRPDSQVPLSRHKAVPALQPLPAVEPHTIQAPALLPEPPSLIVIAAPQLPAEPQPEDAQVCRAPQRLPDSRLLGPEVCLPQSEWNRIAQHGLVLLPDGQTLIASYDKERARRVGSCGPRGLVSGSMNAAYGTICF